MPALSRKSGAVSISSQSSRVRTYSSHPSEHSLKYGDGDTYFCVSVGGGGDGGAEAPGGSGDTGSAGAGAWTDGDVCGSEFFSAAVGVWVWGSNEVCGQGGASSVWNSSAAAEIVGMAY